MGQRRLRVISGGCVKSLKSGSYPGDAMVPIENFWTLSYGGSNYSFDLNSVQVDHQSNNSLALIGEGVLHATDFDATPGNWFYTTQDKATTFSAESVAAPVPEPGTMMLLSAGLFGLAIFAKRRDNRDDVCPA